MFHENRFGRSGITQEQKNTNTESSGEKGSIKIAIFNVIDFSMDKTMI